MKKILVVDNDQFILEILKDLLSKEGHQVLTAQDGLSALDVLETVTPDIIFVDLVMPNIDGKKLCKIVRRMENLKDTYIAILSATAKEDSTDITELGANTCIAKGPIDQMSKDILGVLAEPQAASSRYQSGETLGGPDIAQRGITKELLSLKKHFEVVLERMTEGILEISKDARIVSANRAASLLADLPEENLLGQRLSQLFAEKDRQRIRQLLEGTDDRPRTLFKDNPVSLNKYQVTLDVIPIPGVDGKAIVILNNVSEQKNAEQALKRSEERYRLLFENANDAIFIAQDGVVKFPNRRTVEITGYSEKELTEIPFADLVHPKDRNKVIERHKRRLGGERFPSSYAFRILNRSGDELWVELTAVLIDWEGRSATLNFLRDITEKKRLETHIQQAQRMEAVGTLAGGLAHDFNNLLMAIQGNASLMLLKKDSGDPDYRRLKNIEQYVRDGAKHTKQLLGFARGGKYQVKAADLNEIVEKSSAMFGQTKKEITIHKKYEMDIWPVEVDSGQIQQVLMNIYINAWQALPGGGDLFIETENIQLDRSFVRPYGIKSGKYVKLSLTDTGVGMDDKTQQRIFDPFFTTKEMGQGSGLGLASAYGIIGNHGGIIDVHSRKGEGTTFSIYLPASRNEAIKEKEFSEEILKGTETILLVDDEEMIIEAGKEMLEEIGYAVLVSGSGIETVDIYKARGKEIHLVILDMIIPDMGGGEIYDRLKQLNPEIKVLLSSGYSLNSRATEILERGCSGFIQKPFDIEEISHKIREILDKD